MMTATESHIRLNSNPTFAPRGSASTSPIFQTGSPPICITNTINHHHFLASAKTSIFISLCKKLYFITITAQIQKAFQDQFESYYISNLMMMMMAVAVVEFGFQSYMMSSLVMVMMVVAVVVIE